ncbi:MAG: hypothetical protein FWC33_05615 [Candidatus Bathyarchaeota archaeon]|nr:hypothetical protein [Candidatus Termiticorpusculum sp.]
MNYKLTQNLSLIAFIITVIYASFNLSGLMKKFGAEILYGRGAIMIPVSWSYYFTEIFVLTTLICVTVVLYCVSRVQRKRQTRNPLRFTTTKLLLLPIILLSVYPVIIYVLHNPWWLPVYSVIPFSVYGLFIYACAIPVLLFLMLFSFVFGRRQTRKEQQQQKDTPMYSAVTD